MLGVLQSAASDFSYFCCPRSLCSPGICNEVHETAIEERYCPKEHVHYFDDQEWEELLARGLELFNESEADLFSTPTPEPLVDNVCHPVEDVKSQDEEETVKVAPCAPPPTPVSTLSTPSLISSNDNDDGLSSAAEESEPESDYVTENATKMPWTGTRTTTTSNNKRKRGKGPKILNPRKRLCRSDSVSSVTTVSSIASIGSNPSSTTAQLLQAMMNSDNPWKCPHCPWIQHTQRLPDFLRHQRSHFVSQSDWPCPNPKCGKGFARKDSLKRHLDNKATGCKRPPGYTVC